jgi:hypothetical protein
VAFDHKLRLREHPQIKDEIIAICACRHPQPGGYRDHPADRYHQEERHHAGRFRHLGGALPPVDAIREACLLRFRPIMMTTAARRRAAASAMCSKPLRASACVATQQTTTGHQTRQASTGPTSKETGRRPARGWACISNLGRFRFLPQNREGALFAISLT